MISAVYDSNDLLSGFVSAAGPPGQGLRAWMEGTVQLVLSEPIIEEVARAF